MTSLPANRAQAASQNTTAYARRRQALRDAVPGDRVAQQVAEGHPVVRDQARVQPAQLRDGVEDEADRMVKITTAIVAPIGCSVSVETNSPTAPRAARPTRGRAPTSTSRQHAPSPKPICVPGQQRQRPGAEQGEPDDGAGAAPPAATPTNAKITIASVLHREQPGAVHRHGEQVAQRADVGLAGDRVAGEQATASGRNSAELDGERGERDEQPVVGDRGRGSPARRRPVAARRPSPRRR